MKLQMPTNKRKVERMAPKPFSLAKIKIYNFGYNYPRAQQIGVSLNWSISDRLEKYLSGSQIGLHEFLNLAIATANQEILDEYFGGMSQEQFASLLPILEKPPCQKNKRRITFGINGAANLCARRLAAPNLNFSEYMNRAVWRFLEKSS